MQLVETACLWDLSSGDVLKFSAFAQKSLSAFQQLTKLNFSQFRLICLFQITKI